MKFDLDLLKRRWVSYTIATCAAVILYMVLSNIGSIFSGIVSFFSFIRPVVMGIVVAYIFNPLADMIEGKVLKEMKNEKTRWNLSVLLTLIIVAVFIILLGVALVPQLAESVYALVSNMDSYVKSLQNLLRGFQDGKGKILGIDFAVIINFGESVLGSISTYFKENMDSFVVTTSNIGRALFDLLMALILAIYFLFDKKGITKRCNYLFLLLMKNENHEKFIAFLDRCNDITIRYISVDIFDGLIVGIVNFLFMIIMGMPYSVLVSVIVGVTNLAPTFGPLVGAVLGSFILVLINPWHALWFLIFTIILQTADGYVIKPKLFGGSLGVSSLMILIAIILGGRLFGVAGILLAIPVAAIIDFTWKDFVIKRLEERHAKRYNI